MNTNEQVISLYNRIFSLMNVNRGIITLTFFDGKQVTGKVLNSSSGGNENGVYGTVTIFTDNINNPTTYNLFDVQEVG